MLCLFCIFGLFFCTNIKSKIDVDKKTGTETINSNIEISSNEDEEQKIAIFNKEIVKGKLGVWFFSLEGNEHTGEAFLIKTPNDKYILVDSGIQDSADQLKEYLEKLEIEGIDYGIATHMHMDHIGGFPDIIEKHKMNQMYTSTLFDYNTSIAQRFAVSLSQNKIERIAAQNGMILQADEDVIIEFLHPQGEYEFDEKNPPEKNGSITNNTSVVFKLTYGEKEFLFTGDIELETELFLIENMEEKLKSDFIKIPHHGSSSSSSLAFVKSVGAQNSVMCIYAFNDFDVYNKYKLVGEAPYVTSLDGTILMVSDGEDIKFYTEKERKR